MKNTVSGPEPGPVVVGVDGSEPARQAALWAAGEAERRGRPLRIVYGADTDGRALYASAETIERVRAAGRELLDETVVAVKDTYPGLVVTTELSRGDAAAGLHRAAGLRGTIVVGNRGLGGFSSLMLGSVGLKVAAGARTPVIVVRGTGSGPENGTVLAGVRDAHDLDCVRHAAHEAELRKAELRLLHVWNVLQSVGDVVTMMDDLTEIADEYVRHLTAVTEQIRREFPDLTVRADAEKSTSVAAALVEASRHADLLVMGGRRASAYLGPTLGRHTHSLVHHSHCPVLLVPRHKDEKESAS
ncbi:MULTISPECIES: universal stress protein [unclassified Streptomyces]|uniref:universal stress protein n=1 Tax=unclassified Streptomyces TaxID=2593676 RepID=UPI000449DB1B|nr:universal stress protein [Streptomyces sp. PCS3-D2]WKV70569.1 universal stress protein [Streptomyces sp. PCS3-D2]